MQVLYRCVSKQCIMANDQFLTDAKCKYMITKRTALYPEKFMVSPLPFSQIQLLTEQVPWAPHLTLTGATEVGLRPISVKAHGAPVARDAVAMIVSVECSVGTRRVNSVLKTHQKIHKDSITSVDAKVSSAITGL